MSSLKTRLSDVIYNPAERAFEARVTVFDGGEAITYPMSLRAGLDADEARVSEALTEMALRRHRRPGKGELRMRRQESQGFDAIPAAIHSATNALWDRIFGRAPDHRGLTAWGIAGHKARTRRRSLRHVHAR